VAAAARATRATLLLVGDPATLRRAAELVGVGASRVTVVERVEEIRSGEARVWAWASAPHLAHAPRPGKPSREDGAHQLAYIDQALALVTGGSAAALVTAPVSKEAIATSGARGTRRFRGHTEYLAERVGAREVVMAFESEEIVTSLVTTHLPLRRVPRAVTPEAVERATYWLARLLVDLGHETPKVAVASLNPHAGEGGILGGEEREAIAPGIRRARRRLAKEGLRAEVHGPIGAETAFRKAKARGFDGVVAMYHDQATIPMKLLSFGEAVNVTLGLPIVRTSVDHGTAYDIAWSGHADPHAMERAVELAIRLALHR
jgi:4-hydroxythreonine-4-phosphate dehydrogenase